MSSSPFLEFLAVERHETAALLKHIEGSIGLMAKMIYASGLLRIEVVRLRVNSVDFDQSVLRIWSGKGDQ